MPCPEHGTPHSRGRPGFRAPLLCLRKPTLAGGGDSPRSGRLSDLLSPLISFTVEPAATAVAPAVRALSEHLLLSVLFLFLFASNI